MCGINGKGEGDFFLPQIQCKAICLLLKDVGRGGEVVIFIICCLFSS